MISKHVVRFGSGARPHVAAYARPQTDNSNQTGAAPASSGTPQIQEDDYTFGSLNDGDIVNYDMAADIIIGSLEEEAMGDVPMAMHGDITPKPLPPAEPPQMPMRTDPARLLDRNHSRSSLGTANDAEQDTLAISADVKWQQGPPSERISISSTSQGEGSRMQEVSIGSITSPQGALDSPPLTFGGACLLTGVLFYAIQLGQQSEIVARGSGSQALALLRQRQQQNFFAQHTIDESDGKTTEQRIQAARAEAERAAAEHSRRQQEYAEVAAREAARQRRLRDKARQEYEAAEARRAADLAKRIAAERELSKQRADERRKAEEALRQAQEEAAQKAAAEAEKQRLRDAAAAEAAAAAAAEEQAALQKEQQVFVLRTAGRVAASKARPGMVTEGPVMMPAKVEMAAEVSNVLVGELGPVARGAATLEDAQDLTISVGGEVANLFRQANTEAFMTQQVMGTGPLTLMDSAEVRHWMNQACMAVQAAATATLRTTLDQLEQSDLKVPATQNFAIKLERGVLPQGHDRRTDAMLAQRILDVQGGDLGARDRLQQHLDNLSNEEASWVWPALHLSSKSVSGCDHVVDICIAAHVLDRAQQLQSSERPAKGTCDEHVVDLMCQWLTSRLSSAPPDGLLDIAEMACWTIGDDHPIAKHVLILAEENMSSERKQAVVNRQRALDAIMAEQLLKQERQSARELSDEQALEKHELTPVPERVWALRNIAATMALGDRKSKEKARELYSKALQLQRSYLTDDRHPGLLGELWRLAELLQLEDDWQADAAITWEECLEILEIVIARFRGQGDLVSATSLAEGSCAALESKLGPSHPAIRRLIMSADNMFSALDDSEQEQVIAWRGSDAAVDTLIKNFTKALRPYEVLTGNQNIPLWDRGHIESLMQ
eukprot:jgi/Ulvmu1/4694/UM002_0425.1